MRRVGTSVTKGATPRAWYTAAHAQAALEVRRQVPSDGGVGLRQLAVALLQEVECRQGRIDDGVVLLEQRDEVLHLLRVEVERRHLLGGQVEAVRRARVGRRG